MNRVKGIGGVFFRAAHQQMLNQWYEKNLGLPLTPDGVAVFQWKEHGDPAKEQATIWSTFPNDTDYFGEGKQQFMLNYIVDSLDEMLAQLRAAGATVDEHREESELGRFGWVYDPEGNRIELWEPPAQ